MLMQSEEARDVVGTELGLKPQSSPRVFTVSKELFVTGLLGVLVFVPMTAAGVWLPLVNRDDSFGGRVIPAMMAGGVFGGMALLSAYALFAYRRMRLITSPTHVRVIGVFRDRTVLFSEVAYGRWRCVGGGGRLVLRAPPGRVVVDFALYDGGRELYSFFQTSVPKSVQKNFKRFEATYIRARQPIVIGGTATLWLSVASLLLAVAWWAMWNVRWVRMSSFFPIMVCPTIAVMATIDCVRRPSRIVALASLTAWAAVVCVFKVFLPGTWPR
jgi:hypothetical protein